MDANPGPIDGSVLYDQDKHVSAAVWDGQERGALRCHEHTSKLGEWKLTPKQIELVEKLDLDAPSEEVERCTRAYLLYLVGSTIFSTTTGNKVPVMYLPLFESFEEAGNYAWGAAALAFLYRALGNAVLNLKCWSYFHLNIGRPKLNRDPIHDHFPFVLRWKGKQSGPTTNRDVVFYRKALDSLKPIDVEWPYKYMDSTVIPEDIRDTLILGRSKTMLICFDKAERHLPDRCLRQYSMLQPIPEDVVRWVRKSRGVDGGVDLSGKMESNLMNDIWFKRNCLLADTFSTKGLDGQQFESITRIRFIAQDCLRDQAGSPVTPSDGPYRTWEKDKREGAWVDDSETCGQTNKVYDSQLCETTDEVHDSKPCEATTKVDDEQLHDATIDKVNGTELSDATEKANNSQLPDAIKEVKDQFDATKDTAGQSDATKEAKDLELPDATEETNDSHLFDASKEEKDSKLPNSTEEEDLLLPDATKEGKGSQLPDSTKAEKDSKLPDSTEKEKDLLLPDATKEGKDLQLSETTEEGKDPQLADATEEGKDLQLPDATEEGKDLQLPGSSLDGNGLQLPDATDEANDSKLSHSTDGSDSSKAKVAMNDVPGSSLETIEDVSKQANKSDSAK
ncbi:hypothetical protein GH714_030875 [Hevea brasiliensis]|uniref:Aminotransferase-like plant mobile domain-containing protein n=1 Tax=Hevea brasiliensis TaxID=3981 RepID=A0A6A6K9M6_HEVBR|nr:hypothetical protein GH714_030875 [Hevea brasiliensis]